MSINSIEIKENIWNAARQQYETTYKTITRDEYSGDFDEFILDEMNSGDIEDYAIRNLDLVDPDDVEEKEIGDFYIGEILHEAREQGYEVVKCKTITDNMRFQQLKEIMQLQ